MGSQSASDFEQRFEELVTLKTRLMRTPHDFPNSLYGEKVREIRDFYLGSPPDAAFFLEGKLADMNHDEQSHETGPDDVEGGIEYLVSLADSERPSYYVKYEVCNLLAVLYPRVDEQQRRAVLKALVNSYTPLTHGLDDVKEMDGALFRLGPSGVDVLPQLANSDSEFVRCHASELMETISQGKGPPIDCKGPSDARSRSIEAWAAWLRVNQDHLRWPKVPDYFDSSPTQTH